MKSFYSEIYIIHPNKWRKLFFWKKKVDYKVKKKIKTRLFHTIQLSDMEMSNYMLLHMEACVSLSKDDPVASDWNDLVALKDSFCFWIKFTFQA